MKLLYLATREATKKRNAYVVYHLMEESEMANGKLKVATCQFPVSGNIEDNGEYIRGYIKKAASQEADVVHFCEFALSGYPGLDFPSYKNYDWERLRLETHKVQSVARENRIWVVLGSSHYISPEERPTICLYVISDSGEIVDRYDKCFVAEDCTPGNHRVIITLKGVKCGFLICYDLFFPEIYNLYRHKGVEVMFHSFYAGDPRDWLWEILPAMLRTRAADNGMWIVATNSSAKYSCLPACFVRPDGSIAKSLKTGIPGILFHEFPDDTVMDETLRGLSHSKMMKLAENEIYHNGKPSNHPRALDRRALPQ